MLKNRWKAILCHRVDASERFQAINLWGRGGPRLQRERRPRPIAPARSFMHFNACKSFIPTHCREKSSCTCTVAHARAQCLDEKFHGASVLARFRARALEYLSFSAKSNSIAMNVPSAPASPPGKTESRSSTFKLKQLDRFFFFCFVWGRGR